MESLWPQVPLLVISVQWFSRDLSLIFPEINHVLDPRCRDENRGVDPEEADNNTLPFGQKTAHPKEQAHG